jgi:septal ring factor EnvC (AmiA/AmiB activator)
MAEATAPQAAEHVARTVHERFMRVKNGAAPQPPSSPSTNQDAHLDFIRVEVSKSTSEVKQNTQTLKDQETMIKTLTVTSSNQGSTLDNINTKVDSVYSKIEKLEQLLNECPTLSQIKEMSSPVASTSTPTTDADIDNLRTTLVSLSSNLTADITSVQKEIVDIKTTIPSSADIKGAMTNPDTIRKIADECCQANTEAIKGIEKRSNYTSDELCTTKEKAVDVEQKLINTATKLTDVTNNVNTLETTVSKMKTDVEESNFILSHVDDALSALSPDVEKTRTETYTRIATLNSEIEKNAQSVARLVDDVSSNKQMSLDFKTFMATMSGNMESLKSAVHSALEDSRRSTASKLTELEESMKSVRLDIKGIAVSSAGGLKFDGRSTVTADTSDKSPGELPLSSNICYSRASGSNKQSFTLPKCTIDGKLISLYVSKSPGGCVFLIGKNIVLPEGNMIRVEDGGSVSLVYSDTSSSWTPMNMSKTKFVLAYEMP